MLHACEIPYAAPTTLHACEIPYAAPTTLRACATSRLSRLIPANPTLNLWFLSRTLRGAQAATVVGSAG